MAALDTTEGQVSFNAPGASEQPITTWYKIVGDLESSTQPPLVVLHGGPGAGHEYLSPLADLYHAYQVPIIFYDQVGCGRSTHFREKIGDTSFWTFDLFLRQLDNLIDHLKLRSGDRGFYLLGQSWGGILCGAYAARQPEGLRKIIIASGPASIPLYIQGCQALLAELPADVRETIEDCDRRGDHDSEAFQRAAAVFYGRHVCRLDPYPDDVLAAFAHLKEDPTAYLTIQGPSEFVIVGSIKEWEGWQESQKIKVGVLLLNGRYDEVTDLCMAPWFKHIAKVKWVTLENSSHMGQFEERERFIQVCGDFLKEIQ